MNFIGDISFTSVNNDDIMKRIVDNERLQRPDLDLEKSTITLRHLYIKTNKDAKMIINENDIINVKGSRVVFNSVYAIKCITSGVDITIEYVYGDRIKVMPTIVPDISHLEEKVDNSLDNVSKELIGLEEKVDNSLDNVSKELIGLEEKVNSSLDSISRELIVSESDIQDIMAMIGGIDSGN